MKMQTSELLGQVSTMYWMNRIEIVDPDFIEMIEYVIINRGVPS